MDQYKRNLTAMVRHPHIAEHGPKMLLVTPPPVDEIKLGKLDTAAGFPSATRTSATTASYAETAREVARENAHVALVDLWEAIMDEAIAMAPGDYAARGPWLGSPESGKQGGLDTLLPDGLHLSGRAYRILYELVEPHIGAEWRGLPAEDRSGYLFPDWRLLNPSV